jgi:hypothetical protein
MQGEDECMQGDDGGEEGRCMKEMTFVCRKTGWGHAG